MSDEQPATATPPGETKKPHKGTAFDRVRRHFLAGIFVIIPAFIAVYAVILIMNFADGIFGNFVEEILGFDRNERIANAPFIGMARSLVSFLLACLGILFVGWLSTFLLVRKFINIGERIVNRVPLIKFFYNTPKEVINTFAMSQKNSFKRVVMFEYPRRGAWVLGFATGQVTLNPGGRRFISVFMPTTPNPTTGFLMYMPVEDIFDINVEVEEGFRMIISGGILAPEALHSVPFKSLEELPDLPPLGPLHVEHEAISSPEPGPPKGTA